MSQPHDAAASGTWDGHDLTLTHEESCSQFFYRDPQYIIGHWMCVHECRLLVGADEQEIWSLAPYHVSVKNVLIASTGEMSLTQTPLKLMTFYLF